MSLAATVDALMGLGEKQKTYTLINWGSSKGNMDFPLAKRVLNPTSKTKKVSDKLSFFQMCRESADGPRVPPFWETPEEALAAMGEHPQWVILGRNRHGSCGMDIKFFSEEPDNWNASDFFVKYIPKKDEYRIHVFKYPDGYKVLTQQRKALRSVDPISLEPIDRSNVNFKIRNHRNGFIFQRNDIAVPDDAVQQAIKALQVSGLDFGAVDVIWNEKQQKAYVLEINTAPGLEGTTVKEYAEAFRVIAAA